MIFYGMLGINEIIIILIFLVIFTVLPIIALIDILKNDFEGNNKLIWILLLIFLGVIGAALYYTIGRKQRIQKDINKNL